jgi:adenylate cyclase
VGDPAIQLLDVLVGAILDRVAAGEHLAASGEVLIDSPTAAALGQRAPVATWRVDASTGLRFAVLSPVPPTSIAPITTEPGVPQALTSPPAHILQPWLLPAVYARHHAGLGAFLTELRPVAILFVRFTGIEYDADPQAGAMLDRLICRVQAILARYDGSLLQLTIGDKGSFLYAASARRSATKTTRGGLPWPLWPSARCPKSFPS